MAIPEYIRRLRSHVGHELLLVPSATAFVRRPGGAVLVVRPREEGRWTLPGGLLEPGETPADTVIRETREETGVDVRPVAVLGVFGGPDGFRRTYLNGDEIECFEVLFDCQVVGAAAASVDGEVSEAVFQPPDELRNWMYPISLASLVEAADKQRTLATIGGILRLL